MFTGGEREKLLNALGELSRSRIIDQRETAFEVWVKKVNREEVRENHKLAPLFNQVIELLDKKIRDNQTYEFHRGNDFHPSNVTVRGRHIYGSFITDILSDRKNTDASSILGEYILIGRTLKDDRSHQMSVILISKGWENEIEGLGYRYGLRARTLSFNFDHLAQCLFETEKYMPDSRTWLNERIVQSDDPLPGPVWKKDASLTERYLLALIADIPDWVAVTK